MKVISPIFSSMSGKLGGAVAAKARGGVQYLRALVIPGNPRTAAQTSVRNILSSIAGYWRGTLTSTQRNSWESLAESSGGEVSGEALYVGHGFHALLGSPVVGNSITDFNTAPASGSTPLSPLSGVTLDVSDNRLNFALNVADPWNAADAGGLNIFVTRPQSASRLSQQHGFTFMGTKDNELTSPAQLAWPFAADPLVAGQVRYVKFVAFTVGGKKSGEQVFRITVQA